MLYFFFLFCLAPASELGQVAGKSITALGFRIFVLFCLVRFGHDLTPSP